MNHKRADWIVQIVQPALLFGVLVLFGGCVWENNFEYYNPLDPQEDAPIAEFLDRLSLRSPPLDPVIRQAVESSGAPTKLSVNHLWVNGFDHGGGVSTLEGIEFFSRIESLDLRSVQLVTNAVDLAPLTQLNRLRWLSLGDNGFGDTEIEAIPHLPSLEFLGLRDNGILDAGSVIPIIERYQSSHLSIDIGSNPFPVATLGALTPVLDWVDGLTISGLSEPLPDFSFLRDNDRILWFDVANNVLPANLEALSLLRGLHDLHLWGTGLDDTRLATLPFLPNLHFLGLGDNAISSGQVLAGYLSGYDTGRLNLNIYGNLLDSSQLAALASVLDRLHWLHIERQNAGPIPDLGFLPFNNTTVVGLGLSQITLSGGLQSSLDISAVSRLTRLEWLDLADNGDNEILGMEVLRDLPHLREVNVSNSANVNYEILDELRARDVIIVGY